MTIRFVEEARREFLEAISAYEQAEAGLGARFKSEAEEAVRWIAAHHELYRVRSSAYRRMNLQVFPYYIAYIIRDETLWILAIAHGSRKPQYWIARRGQVG